MKRSISALVLTLAATHAAADLLHDVTEGCRARVGRHGGDAVSACVAEDFHAADSLSAYPDTARATIARCRAQLRYLGWARIKACADDRLQAEAALADYPEGYEALIEDCRIRMGAFGWHMVKACVDSEARVRGAPPKD